MFPSRLVTLLAFVSIALSSPVFNNFVVHESRKDVPSGFVKSGSAPAGEVLQLRLALVQGDMAGLEEKLFAVSTPDSPLYGQFLTKEEVRLLSLHTIACFYQY